MKSNIELQSEKGEFLIKHPSQRRRRPLLISGFLSVALCYLLYTSIGSGNLISWLACHRRPQTSLSEAPPTTKELVPLEAHIMSKCPDARDCLQLLVLPTMQRVLDKVNFTLSYIGTYVTFHYRAIGSICEFS